MTSWPCCRRFGKRNAGSAAPADAPPRTEMQNTEPRRTRRKDKKEFFFTLALLFLRCSSRFNLYFRSCSSAREFQAAAELRVVEFAVVAGKVAVDPGCGDARARRVALEGRPAALRDDGIVRDGLWRVRIDQGQVGPVTFADEAALAHVESFR